MFFLISLAIALLLAIPTYGLSLVVFFLAKNWFDNKAISVLLGAAVSAMRSGVSEERYHINRAAIRKIFARYAIQPPQVVPLGTGGTTLYWGVIRHPLINDGRSFSLRFGYIPREGSRNTVFVKAAPGVDHEVLSADDLVSAAQFAGVPPVGLATVDNSKPRGDSDIEALIIRAAGLANSELACPKLRYEALSDFLNRKEASTEYFPDWAGARFWIDIGEFSYAVCATPLNPSAKDASGMSLSALIDGYAQVRQVAPA